VNWTRISEYKHAPNQPAGTKDYPGTVIYRSAIRATDLLTVASWYWLT
jgi:hypothetical protein